MNIIPFQPHPPRKDKPTNKSNPKITPLRWIAKEKCQMRVWCKFADERQKRFCTKDDHYETCESQPQGLPRIRE